MHNYDALQAAFDGPFKALTQYRQFMLWQLVPDPEGGKPRKIPFTIHGSKGSSTDPTCWVDAATALQYARHSGNMGVAFVVTDADPFVFIDVDGCVQAGQWDADALETFARFPGAAFEASQSGAGMHLFVAGHTPEGFTGRKRGKFECYRTSRFIALTGTGAQGTVFDYGATVAQFIADKFPLNVMDGQVGELRWTTTPIAEWQGPTDDEELLRQFLAATRPASAREAFAFLKPNAPAIASDVLVSNADLFNADLSILSRAYPSDKADEFDKSRAAIALACRLAYWTGKDCTRIERLMNRAAFRRTRADQYHDSDVTYMQWDVMRACAMTNNVMFQRAPVANAAVVADSASAYDQYADRLSASGDIHTIRGIGSEIGSDGRIDPTLREMLAQHVQRCIELVEGSKLPIIDCRRIVQQRSSHPAPDRQALQRQANIAMNLPEEMPTLAPVLTTAQMLEEFVLVADGAQVGSIYDRSLCYSLSDFKHLLAASRTVTADGKEREHTEDWRIHPGRRSVATRTFRAGGNILTYDPNGRTALNMWRPQPPRQYTMDVTPFYEHVKYLFGDDTEQFLDWLAHIEQRPGELPHHGWLHIADHFGTGRNWLESVISRLWRGYVAPSVDLDSLINGGFNGAIAGRVIAVVDEIRTGAREDAYMMEGRIRNMLTEETRYIKPKYGKEYTEHNSCRWLLFSNHKNAIPMSDSDRRWYVVHLMLAPRPEYVYANLYALLNNPAFIESVGAWLALRDISKFNPGARPPVTAAKLKAIDASKSEYQKAAALIVKHWPCDFITVADLSNVMHEGDAGVTGKRLNAAMRHALDDAGMHSCDYPLYDDRGNKQRCWIVRNVEAWLAPGVLSKDNTANAFAAYRQYDKLFGLKTLQALL
jgi:primase-polymerase (primpol)-like protein